MRKVEHSHEIKLMSGKLVKVKQGEEREEALVPVGFLSDCCRWRHVLATVEFCILWLYARASIGVSGGSSMSGASRHKLGDSLQLRGARDVSQACSPILSLNHLHGFRLILSGAKGNRMVVVSLCCLVSPVQCAALC